MVEIDLTKLNGNENITKLLARILKENRIFVSYIKNLKMENKYRGKNPIYKEYMRFGFENNFVAETVDQLTNHNNLATIANVLRRSFIWSNTPERHDFWMNLCERLISKRYLPEKTDYIELKHLINYRNNGN